MSACYDKFFSFSLPSQFIQYSQKSVYKNKHNDSNFKLTQKFKSWLHFHHQLQYTEIPASSVCSAIHTFEHN